MKGSLAASCGTSGRLSNKVPFPDGLSAECFEYPSYLQCSVALRPQTQKVRETVATGDGGDQCSGSPKIGSREPVGYRKLVSYGACIEYGYNTVLYTRTAKSPDQLVDAWCRE